MVWDVDKPNGESSLNGYPSPFLPVQWPKNKWAISSSNKTLKVYPFREITPLSPMQYRWINSDRPLPNSFRTILGDIMLWSFVKDRFEVETGEKPSLLDTIRPLGAPNIWKANFHNTSTNLPYAARFNLNLVSTISSLKTSQIPPRARTVDWSLAAGTQWESPGAEMTSCFFFSFFFMTRNPKVVDSFINHAGNINTRGTSS